MWGCSNLQFSNGWWRIFSPGSMLSMLIWGLIILLLACLVIWIFRSLARNTNGPFRDRIDSLSILKARFARGEISREEFIKMKQLLS